MVERDGKGQNGWNRKSGNRHMKCTEDRYFSMRFLSQRIYRMRRIYCRRHLLKHFFLIEKTGSIRYWLVTVLRNEFLNLYRKRKREILDGGSIQPNPEESEEKTVIDEIIKQEERKILFYAIQELPIMMKEVLMESTYFHMKDEEIAKMHGITRENVRKIRSRAKQKLIERLEGES